MSGLNCTNATNLSDFLAYSNKIELIKIPINVSAQIDLPDIFYDEDGNAYTSLPMNARRSFWIARKGVNIPYESDTITPVKGAEFRQDNQGVFGYYIDDVFQQNKSGFVIWNGAMFFIVNGIVDSSANGLVNNIDHPEDWYYCANGQVQTQYTGLAEYDGAWFYINKGKLDTTLAAYVEYDGGLFYVAAGRILTEVNGLAQDPNSTDWYYLANGQAQLQYSGLAQYDGEWFYVQNGKLVANYTGKVTYDGNVFEMRNGKLIIPEETSSQNGNSSSSSGNSSSGSNSTNSNGTYVINKRTGVFHKPNCPSVDRMNSSNRLRVTNTTAQELRNSGYKPCENCNPR